MLYGGKKVNNVGLIYEIINTHNIQFKFKKEISIRKRGIDHWES